MQIPGSQKEALVSAENSALHGLFQSFMYGLRTCSRKVDNKLWNMIINKINYNKIVRGLGKKSLKKKF